MTLSELAKLRQTNIETVDRRTLAAAEEVQIDPALPVEQRMVQYLEQIKNPYCFLCGETPVQLYFPPSETDLGHKLKTFFGAHGR